jgi:TonB family protein
MITLLCLSTFFALSLNSVNPPKEDVQGAPTPIILGDPMWTPDAPTLVRFDKIKVIKQPSAPRYPPGESKDPPQGDVLVEVWIDEEGKPISAGAVYGHKPLARAAVTYIYNWRFAPVVIDGKVKPVRSRIVVRFRHKTSNSPIEALPKELIYD